MILIARSGFFRALFSHPEVTESRNGSVQMRDIEKEDMEIFIEVLLNEVSTYEAILLCAKHSSFQFLYTGSTEKIEFVSTAKNLLIAADKYQVGQRCLFDFWY